MAMTRFRRRGEWEYDVFQRPLLADSGRTVASDSPSPIGFQSNAERLQASPLQRAKSIGQAMPSCERSLLPVP